VGEKGKDDPLPRKPEEAGKNRGTGSEKHQKAEVMVRKVRETERGGRTSAMKRLKSLLRVPGGPAKGPENRGQGER